MENKVENEQVIAHCVDLEVGGGRCMQEEESRGIREEEKSHYWVSSACTNT